MHHGQNRGKQQPKLSKKAEKTRKLSESRVEFINFA